MATGTSQQVTTKYPDHMSLADGDLEDIKELLKKSVTRLSIAASGNDKRLDRTLRDIRQAVKHGLNARELEIGTLFLSDSLATARTAGGHRGNDGSPHTRRISPAADSFPQPRAPLADRGMPGAWDTRRQAPHESAVPLQLAPIPESARVPSRPR